MNDIAVICVFFNPSQTDVEKWIKLSENLKDCIFVDNTTKDFVESGVEKLPNYIGLKGNKGIAYAQNIGIKRAKELGYKYVIFFDQDSVISLELIYKLKQEYEALKEKNIKIGAIGPALIEINTGQPYKGSASESSEAKNVESIISSGMLTEIEVLNKVGGMKDKLFIDLVDHEWCWRAKQEGYEMYISGRVFMHHQVGKKSLRFFGFPILISAPVRYYYQYRNTLWLLKSKYAPKVWKKKVIIRKIVEFFLVPLRTDKPLSTWKNMLTGIKDGLNNKL